MPDIRHRVGIAAPRHRVYEMLATKDGLACPQSVRLYSTFGGT